ncbi:hypothetical protein AMIS_24400 [Actinoplanes missouriensis 431]|uniref:Uncharacterized protein n=1 Tax=Actinoplanes missouriensis (strain ATCC 14538 / DSM 43046 / CBS 188.64 / JCM 3121 / NBRC 102363 / NCIMB 12654 / NRRL B-3342 / UNCC 431) TaxID=512565 RepID=I0H3S3_ACTM4|nr:hypothetical protein [Actinoplanes missouriensis]BAL87660.1 hypothetical protein AMIS_24400 [Actinoplanes missouriensis 431]
MTSSSVAVHEPPRLPIRHRRFWSPSFLKVFAPLATTAATGLVLLLISGNLALPFQQELTLEGKTGSKGEIFEDPEMRRLLLRHHIRVHITNTGSRELATHDFTGYDFVFPSGRPAANMVRQRLAQTSGGVPQTSKPFATPLVLATFRQYAETLVAAGVATTQRNTLGGTPYYYILDTAKFLTLIKEGRTWNDLRLERQADGQGSTISNGNRVIAHSPSPCHANAGESFLALTAFVENGTNAPPNAAEAPAVTAAIKPLLGMQGMHDQELFASYVTPEGKGKAPIVVVYEHQYLAYQVRQAEAGGAPDTDRVLLYPQQGMLTDPEFIPLNAGADRLGRLLGSDPELRRRAMELGYRVLDPTSAASSDQLWKYLAERGIPAPDNSGNLTKAELPVLDVLEKMIGEVGGCPR